ncbi:MAG: T9SS type A sorting domain-containing protein, partial [Bacteroidia bacterium]
QPSLTAFQFELYPNPAQNVINLRIAAQNRVEITASLVDVNGKLVASLINDTIEAGVKKFHLNKDLFHLVPGVYYIQVQAKGAFRTEKLVIVE